MAEVSDEQKNGVIAHIDSFSVIESHYYRAKTNKKYLEAGLSIQKMYDLYKEKCIRENKPWVKSTYYRYIVNTCYNIDFHIPKTNRCEKCEEIKIKKSQNISTGIEEKNLHDMYIAEKLAMREKKKKLQIDYQWELFIGRIWPWKCDNSTESRYWVILLQKKADAL